MRRAALHLTPFLVLYGSLAVTAPPHLKDAPTYYSIAESLLSGRCAPEGTSCLWAGPGYPAVLAPLVALGLPPVTVQLLNAVFLFGALLLLFGAAARLVPRRQAWWTTIACGLYWPAWDELGYVMTECFATFLLALVLYAAVRLLHDGWRWLLVAAPALAALALTKVVFGYVLTAALLTSLGLLAWRRNTTWTRCAAATACALVLCVPYLRCTYQVTGRAFLWATSGGMQLYWMTSPHPQEHGDWINYVLAGRRDPTDANPVMKNHAPVFRRALGYESNFVDESYADLIKRLGPRQQDVFLAAAADNIVAHPLAYAGNWVANVSRLTLGTPFSYRPQDTRMLRYAVPNVVLIGFLAAALLAHRRRGRTDTAALPAAAPAIGGFVAIYLGGISLLSGYPRFFSILAPTLFWFIAASLHTPAGTPAGARGSTAPAPPDPPPSP